MPWFERIGPQRVLIADLAAAGEHLEDEAEDDEDGQADGAGDQRPGADAGDLPGGAVADPVDQRADHLDGTDHHHQVAHQVHPRQHPGVPQQPDDGQAVAGEVHHGHGDQSGEAEGDAVDVAPGDGGDQADDRQGVDQHVEERLLVEQHRPERLAARRRA